jgi:DNA polymerase
MLIGEAPGADDDQTGRTFVSKAGDFLSELLEMAQIRREDVFMTHAVKCRPADQRKPQPDEVRMCGDTYLDRQIALINPPVIVPLGAFALGRLMPGAKLSAVHGQPKEYSGRIVIPMYHPAAGLYHHQYRNMLIKDFLEMGRYLARQPV